MALKAGAGEGVYMVPAFTGIGAPYWEPDARGAIFGITRGTDRNQIVRATLESLAYQNEDLLSAMAEDLVQFQADVSDTEIVRCKSIESTSLGAAYLAGLAVGYYDSTDDIIENKEVDRIFRPEMDEAKRAALLKGWHKAVKAAIWLAEE